MVTKVQAKDDWYFSLQSIKNIKDSLSFYFERKFTDSLLSANECIGSEEWHDALISDWLEELEVARSFEQKAFDIYKEFV